MTTRIPPRDEMKTQARRLRDALADQGTPLSHGAALEMVARQHGARDWNTAAALADAAPRLRWQVGDAVRGTYLGHAFTGRIKAAEDRGAGWWHLTLVFDTPVDVVTSPAFSNLRRQVRCTVNSQGVTVERTSDGQPHVTLRAA